MNVTELARQLKIPTNDLLDLLPEFGVHVGRRAIKVDDRLAQRILRQSNEIHRLWERRRAREGAVHEVEEAGITTEERAKVVLPPVLTVREFALRLGLPITRVIGELVKNGILAGLNDRIDFQTASIIADDFGFAVTAAGAGEEREEPEFLEEVKTILEGEAEESLRPRPPVVVVMGHVDHGKTKLLDAIRKTDVVATEAGGITQHIGAYQTTVRSKDAPSSHASKAGRGTPSTERKITFIDTPGHEAFTVMRSRGARIADIAILVVAADDGVQPQTLEALRIITAAKLPYVVALNKIDKEGVNVDRVKTQLGEAGVVLEEWGGKTALVPISAKEGTNIDTLLEVVGLVADLERDRIRANPDRPAIGTVIEAKVTKGEGPVATVLVQAGTLRARDPLIINSKRYGRVRAMREYRGVEVKEATPGMPVRVLGFEVAPEVGDILDVSKAEGAERVRKTKVVKTQAAVGILGRASVGEEEGASTKKFYTLYLKADVLGSLEAIFGALEKYQHKEVGVKIAGHGLGNVTDTDVLASEAGGATLYAFHVVPTPQARDLAREKNVVIKECTIIYDLLGDVKKKLEEMLPPEIIVTPYGHARVIALFRASGSSHVVGCTGIDGKLIPGVFAKVVRKGEVIGQGKVLRLKVQKSEVKEVFAGQEFGVEFRGDVALEEGDELHEYKEEKKVRKLIFNV